MQVEILEIANNLKAVIRKEIPNSKFDMIQFISDLDIRFPKSPKAVRVIFEIVYQEKFKEKFIW